MKKLLTLLLLLCVSVSFVGCGSSKNSMALNLENNVNRLNSYLQKSSDISNEDILIKELYSNDYNSYEYEEYNPKNIVSKIDFKNEPEKIKNIPPMNGKTFEIKRLTNSTYIPRRINEQNNDNLMNYISKIEDLYLIMNDAVCANEDCKNKKSDILSYCKLITSLANQLKENKIDLNENQVECCNDLIGELNKDLNNLNNTKNDVKNNCNACKTSNLNPNLNIDQISAKYIKLINSLEQKSTIYNNLLNTLRLLDCTICGKCTSIDCPNCDEKENNIENTEKIDEKIENYNKKLKNIDTFKEKKLKNENAEELKNENEENVTAVENPAVQYIPNGYGYPAGGVMPNGGYGNYGFGYGVHSIENGITNPYRNTDTYKLPTINEIKRGYTVGFLNQPIKDELRKDFKVFQ
ncbi:MAG: hypothetical protein J5779_00250 [Clostridia bacterium]|nr:hypothetical protein [Clostridia bacterium]